jgi:hypothetical protein
LVRVFATRRVTHLLQQRGSLPRNNQLRLNRIFWVDLRNSLSAHEPRKSGFFFFFFWSGFFFFFVGPLPQAARGIGERQKRYKFETYFTSDNIIRFAVVHRRCSCCRNVSLALWWHLVFRAKNRENLSLQDEKKSGQLSLKRSDRLARWPTLKVSNLFLSFFFFFFFLSMSPIDLQLMQ